MLEEVIKYSRKIAFCTSTAQINHNYVHNIGSKRGNYLCSACTTVTQPQTTSRYNTYSTRVHFVFSKNMYFWYAKKNISSGHSFKRPIDTDLSQV